MTLNHKNILFISPEFFNYEKSIVQTLEKLGANVSFFNERPSNSQLSKGLIRVNKYFLEKKIKQYYNDILTKIKDENYHFFLLIKGESIPHFFLKKLRKNMPHIKMIYYNYDSFTEYPQLLNHLPFFDKKVTFDRVDAELYHLDFLPLFHLPNYQKTNFKNTTKYDVSFIGSIHSDRYSVAQKVKLILEKHHLSSYFYFYAPSRITLYLKKCFDKNFKDFKTKDISFQSLSTNEIITIYQNSNVILDICKPFQNGLTMRTFEALAMQKKLITTNADIIHYPFYDKNNILVINRKKIDIPHSFFTSKFKEINDEILDNYSLESWLKHLFMN